MFRLDDNTTNVCVYGVAMTADVLANRRTRSPNIFRSEIWYEKTRMVWLPDGGNIFEDMFIRFDRMHERNGRTNGHCTTA